MNDDQNPEDFPDVRICITDTEKPPSPPGRLIRLVARAGVLISGHPLPLGARLRADQDRKDLEDRWTPRGKA